MRKLGVAVALGALAIGAGVAVSGAAIAQAPAGVVRAAYTVEPYSPPSTITINGTGVRLRAEPSTATQVLSTGSTGLPLTVVGLARMSDWTWYQVILKSGQKGFIRSDLTSAPMRGGVATATTTTTAAAAPVLPPPVAYTPSPTYTTTPTAALPPAPNPPAYSPAPTVAPLSPPATTISAMPPTASTPTYTPAPTPTYTQPAQTYTQPAAPAYTQPTTQPYTQPAAQPAPQPYTQPAVQPRPVQPETGGSAIWLTPAPASPTATSGLQSNPQR
jgi:hypothetical protein